MKNIYLIKYGEIAIKGKNRYLFENSLVDTIKKNLRELGEFEVWKEQGRIIAEPEDNSIDSMIVIRKLQRIFGIVGIAYGNKIDEISMDSIYESTLAHMKTVYGDECHTFKVQTRRSDKKFEYDSMEISSMVGGHLLRNMPDQLTVDVHNPEIKLTVELRKSLYIYSKNYKGAGGMPTGTSGRAMLLLSGGIDSPVAGWMIAKRGVELDAVYYHSPPYTSERAKQKVIDLAQKVSLYCGKINLYVVNFTDIQMSINEKCPPEQLTIIMRRIMMQIAERLAIMKNCDALITGESIGQVASQTIQSLSVTNAAVDLPVFRPLISFDKEDIVTISKNIDTYDISILPYEDCCTLFIPKRPQTKPKLEYIQRSERVLESFIEEMIQKSIDEMELIEI
ncbi:MAG TPA: tRNA 4-thiouridine(8) synthase ThiI [Epulopiscium sp.]|nr:tRNA 4-thiouridine(8) synthase ThiI [Candidatus Epulonipiscium sp.]